MKKTTVKNFRQQRAHMTRSVHVHWHDVLTVLFLVLKPTNHFQEFCYSFD